MRTFIVTILIFFSLTKANACECPEFDNKTIKELIESADFVVIGKATTNIHFDKTMQQLLNLKSEGSDVLFKVDSVIKGDVQKNEILFIYQEGGSCTQMFKFEKSYLIFGNHINKFIKHQYEKNYDKGEIPPPPPPSLINEEQEIHADKQIIRFLNKQTTKYKTGTTNLCSSLQMDVNEFDSVIEQVNK